MDAAVRYWTKGFYHDFLDREILQYGTEPGFSDDFLDRGMLQ
jgi:hypothetical protein